jgi:hypothetical protein
VAVSRQIGIDIFALRPDLRRASLRLLGSQDTRVSNAQARTSPNRLLRS